VSPGPNSSSRRALRRSERRRGLGCDGSCGQRRRLAWSGGQPGRRVGTGAHAACRDPLRPELPAITGLCGYAQLTTCADVWVRKPWCASVAVLVCCTATLLICGSTRRIRGQADPERRAGHGPSTGSGAAAIAPRHRQPQQRHGDRRPRIRRPLIRRSPNDLRCHPRRSPTCHADRAAVERVRTRPRSFARVALTLAPRSQRPPTRRRGPP
jgi:hypothetical protein